jgi:hypothetical protein
LRNRRALALIATLLVVAAGAAIVVVRSGEPPPGASRVSQEFVDAWNAGDFQAMYAMLSTPIAGDIFVDALSHSAAPIRDVRLERFSTLNDHQVVTTYSARVPDLTAAVTGVVFANRFRYPDACSEESGHQATFQRLEDTLDLEQDGAGDWRIGLRGDTDFLQGGAKLLALSFDLVPGFIWQHITADADPTSDAYDHQVIDEAIAAYNRDLALDPGDAPSANATVQAYIRQTATSCLPAA